MKRKLRYITTAVVLAAMATTYGQSVVKVGKASYAEYPPLSISKSTTHNGDQTKKMLYRKLNIHERAGQPIPTNDWWTNMINGDDHTNGDEITGHLWSYPLYVQARKSGLDIKYPTYWMDNGTEMLANTKIVLKGLNFNPANGSATAQYWHDWDVAFSLQDGNKLMYTTMVHGMPFTWIEMRNMVPTVQIVRDDRAKYTADNMKAVMLQQDGVTAMGNGEYVTDGFIVGMTNDADGMTAEYYGVFLPEKTTVKVENGVATLHFYGGQQYVVIGTLPSKGDYAAFADYAYSVPRSTEVTWRYDSAAGKLRTYWDITAENLLTGVAIPDFGTDNTSPAIADEPSKPSDDGSLVVPIGDDGYTGPAHAPRYHAPATEVKVLQGFLPHHYRDYSTNNKITTTSYSFRTPHGVLKLAEGTHFEIDYDFYGILPYYACPTEGDDAIAPYDEAKMTEMLQRYADTGTFGTDTYWGGKGLTQMALNMMFAREMGNDELYTKCHDRLKEAFVNWLTYTPGDKESFFAYYPRYGGMVGYGTSYDSDTFNDRHFHYGYFTLAGAMLALVDTDFRDNYGELLKMIAKDYANWDKTDTRFPFFRTLDPWAGHSFAGGMGDGNGNGQESTSEAMQGWGGLYLLGVALGDDEMRDAGIFGWVTEARGTAEYWFDRHKDASRNMATFHTKTNGDYENGYNIDYSKFSAQYSENGVEKTMTPPYNSNLTCHGVGYWTYFGFDAVFMQGIQWMPISPALDYMSEDKEFAAWDIQRMMDDMFHNGFLDNTGTATLANSDWGNVALSYWQRSNPQEVARIFDEGWNSGYGTYKTSATNGITYFVTHSHLRTGDIDWSIHASIPTARVYGNGANKKHIAFNPTDASLKVTYSDGYSHTVPAHQLKVNEETSKALDKIFTEETAIQDFRDGLEMANLALNKPTTASGSENNTTMNASAATDGKDDTRWASEKTDNQWIAVDLGKEARLYKLKIHWEAAYAAQYKVQLSNDGESWYDAKTANSSGGWDEIMLGDATAQHIRILCTQRVNNGWGISIYELQAFGAYTDALPTDMLGVKITSEKEQLKQYEPCQMHIEGYTVSGSKVSVSPTWSSKDGKVTTDGIFTPRVVPSAIVSAQVGELKVSKSLPVEEEMFTAYLTLSPTSIEIPVNEAHQLYVEVKNQFGEPMNANLDNVAWRVCTYVEREENYMDGDIQKNRTVYDLTDTDNGTISTDGKVTFTAVGEYAIVATDGDGSDIIFASVKTYADINLALNKPVEVTSGNNAEKAVDGIVGAASRWESEWGVDPQSLTVNLQAVYRINKVSVTWEAAGAENYSVEYSADGVNWHLIENVTDGVAGTRNFTGFSVDAQFVRIKGTKRLMEAYGYSIEELQVYGTSKVSDAVATLHDNGVNEINAHVLAGAWNDNDFATIDANNMAGSDDLVAYDLRSVNLKEGTSFDTQNPNAYVIIAPEQVGQVVNSKNVVVNNSGSYTSKNIEFIDGNRINNRLTVNANTASYSRKVNGTCSTLALPFSCNVPAGFKAYQFSEFRQISNDVVKLIFTDATSIEAGIPYIIERQATSDEFTTATDVVVDFTEKNISKNSVTFKSNFQVLSNVPGSMNAYTLKTNGDRTLYKHDTTQGSGRITEFRGYFVIPSEIAGAKVFSISFNDELTGLHDIEASNDLLGAIFNVYSIDGKRIRTNGTSLIGLPAGIYIVNGKKMVVR